MTHLNCDRTQATCDRRGLTEQQCTDLRLNVTKFLAVADLNISAADCELLQVALDVCVGADAPRVVAAKCGIRPALHSRAGGTEMAI